MMNNKEFLNTKWDARDWSVEMKRKWQKRMFELGFYWEDGSRNFDGLDGNYYYISKTGLMCYSHRMGTFRESSGRIRKYADAFPETEQRQKHDSEKPRSQPRNKYDREILPGVYVDVYDVLRAFKTRSPALDHAAKKLLASGERGHKDRLTDLQECISSIQAEIDSMGERS